MGSLSLEPGSLFARDFRIERPLAEGGMGAVYIAQQLSTGRRRALKLMQPELVQNDDLRRRFILEAKVGASIPSEHVVEVQLAGVDDQTGAPFLVMELLDGEDLQTRLERVGRLSADDIRELFRQMCHALRLAHEAGVVHRDLKPANIFLATPKREGAGFHVKVLDFGIAKMTNDATASGAKTGMIGTPLWMAPEQADHAPISPAADVWALGLILYTCVTGRSFWRNGNAEDVSLQQIFREMLFDPIPSATDRAREQGAEFPPALETLIARSVVRRAGDRLPDAGAFFAALEDALEGRALPTLAKATTFGGAMLEAPDFDMAGAPALQLAHEPRRLTTVVPSPSAMTLSADPTPPPLARMRAVTAPVGPPLLEEGRRLPWWLVYIVPLAVVALFALVARSMMHPSAPLVLRRLGTVEKGSYANGAMPFRELRHDAEERFPELDARCVKDATTSGRATLHWVIEDGMAKHERVEGGGSTGMCLLTGLARRPYPIFGEFSGRTEVTYIVEWNPDVKAP